MPKIVIVYTDTTHRELACLLNYELNTSLITKNNSTISCQVLQRDQFVRLVENHQYDVNQRTALHIFVDLHHLTSESIPFRVDDVIPHYIAYNYVIISRKFSSSRGKADIIRMYQNAQEVWDYAHFNLQTFKDVMHISPKMVPFCYSSYFDTTKRYQLLHSKKDIDVLFIGGFSDRRMNKIREMQEHGLTVKYVDNVFGEPKDQLIHRANILINIYKEDVYTESFANSRLAHYLSNLAFVISEVSNDQILTDQYQDLVIFCPLDQLIQTCQEYLNNPERRQQFADRAYELYSTKFRYIDCIKATNILNFVS